MSKQHFIAYFAFLVLALVLFTIVLYGIDQRLKRIERLYNNSEIRIDILTEKSDSSLQIKGIQLVDEGHILDTNGIESKLDSIESRLKVLECPHEITSLRKYQPGPRGSFLNLSMNGTVSFFGDADPTGNTPYASHERCDKCGKVLKILKDGEFEIEAVSRKESIIDALKVEIEDLSKESK